MLQNHQQLKVENVLSSVACDLESVYLEAPETVKEVGFLIEDLNTA